MIVVGLTARSLLELQATCPLEDSEQVRHRLTGIMNSIRITPR